MYSHECSLNQKCEHQTGHPSIPTKPSRPHESHLDDFLDQQCDKGVSDQAFSSATSGTKYYAVAAFLNSEGAVCSKIFKKEFTGGAVSTSSTASSTLSLQAPKCRAFSLTPATPRLVKVPAVKR